MDVDSEVRPKRFSQRQIDASYFTVLPRDAWCFNNGQRNPVHRVYRLEATPSSWSSSVSWETETKPENKSNYEYEHF